MDRQTLVNYGWIVIAALVIAIMLALATPFGKYVMDGVSSVASGYINASNKAMSEENKDKLVAEWEDKWANSVNTNKGYDHSAPELHKDDGTGVYSGKTYTFGNYEYRYNQEYNFGWENAIINGWGVRCVNNVADPGPVLESINGAPIISLEGTFADCTNLIVAPHIPEHVKHMEKTFCNCSSLTTAPVLPDGITSLWFTFSGCSSLKTYEGSKDANGDFGNYKIPNSVTSLSLCFSGCTQMRIAPAIHEGVTNVGGTFGGCTALTQAPVIPSTATCLRMTFQNCTSLSGTITINSTPTTFEDYEECLKETQVTEILGSCGNKSAILATK